MLGYRSVLVLILEQGKRVEICIQITHCPITYAELTRHAWLKLKIPKLIKTYKKSKCKFQNIFSNFDCLVKLYCFRNFDFVFLCSL